MSTARSRHRQRELAGGQAPCDKPQGTRRRLSGAVQDQPAPTGNAVSYFTSRSTTLLLTLATPGSLKT